MGSVQPVTPAPAREIYKTYLGEAEVSAREQYSGWIERDGMRQFTFDGKEAAGYPASGSYSLAGRPAGQQIYREREKQTAR